MESKYSKAMVIAMVLSLKEWKEEKESENLIPTVDLLIEELEEAKEQEINDENHGDDTA